MKKVEDYKDFVIAQDAEKLFHIFSADEWDYGEGCRYPEHEAGSIKEAKDFVDSY